ncbi:DUF1887 family protein [Marinithermus hydrothermalis]|uniref:DUF1887 family protein n=1 Tax=Marinithermus hydrothermalis (strain DSM 14884 / JCM 11576 / T1) TaxID=869210 RepID=F2NNB1_MARHT|nr:DUF1887 family protein [Marinithermus hydrothermalis]AEB10952.1 hypothetical protein Marky_0191 [Marinithermus hydrothermalis DSM 14884]
MGILTRYLAKAMERARYDLLAAGRYAADIPEFSLHVEANNLEAARHALQEALEERVLESLRLGLPLPELDGLTLGPTTPKAERFRQLVLELWQMIQGEAPPEEAPEAPPPPKRAGPNTLEEWLASRGIKIQRRPTEESEEDREREKVLARLALFLGDRYPTLTRVYEKLKQSLSTKRQFQLSLTDASQEEISNSTQFCTSLKQYALLTSYHYKSEERRLRAKASTEGWVQNFLTGGWLESYVMQKIQKALRSKNLPHEVARGLQVTLPNGDQTELDVLVLVQGRVFWFETKTGDFQAHIAKYSKLKKTLGLSAKESFLVLLGVDKARARELSALHNVTVVNQATFLDAFLEALGLVETPAEA